jgi:quercetin dioxygenase-like cupin family protein
MESTRVFSFSDHAVAAAGEPVRTVVLQSEHAVVVAWLVLPGQSIRAHLHPSGQDSWTVLAGEGEYFLDDQGATTRLRAGDLAVARAGEVHGVRNTGTVPLEFVSVVSPADAGYQAL